MTPRFDPTRALIVDIGRGQLRDDESTSRLNLPAHVLFSLCESAGSEATSAFAHALGADLGRRAASSLGKVASEAPVEAWVEHLGGQLALVGLGDLSIEQWGRALVLGVSGAPRGSATILGAVLQSALQRGLSREAALVAFGSDDAPLFLVVSKETAPRIEQLKQGGAKLGQVVETLHEGAA